MLNRKQRRAMGIPGAMARHGHCHKLLKEVSMKAAAEHYEELMSASNWSFEQWKLSHPDLAGEALQAAFVEEHWGKYLGFAKATLAQLLTSPTLDEAAKSDIYDALVLDNSLQRGRGNVGPPSRVLNPAFGAAYMEKK